MNAPDYISISISKSLYDRIREYGMKNGVALRQMPDVMWRLFSKAPATAQQGAIQSHREEKAMEPHVPRPGRGRKRRQAVAA
jgi:hypothetical protein